MSMNTQEQFKVITGSFEKVLVVKDAEDKDVELILSYPRMRNSHYFWDALMVLTETYDKVAKKGNTVEEAMDNLSGDTTDIVKLASQVIPKLTDYICNNLERKHNKTFTEDEKDYYYLVILKNMNQVITEFTTLFANMFPKEPKASKESP